MKRKVSLWLGVVALGAIIYVAGRTTAQQSGGGEPRTRIAMINLTKVLKGYGKVVAFQEETKKLMQPYEEKGKGIQTQIELHQKELQKKLEPATRDQYEKNLKTYQRQFEDLGVEAKAQFAKKAEEQMVIIYREIWDAAQRIAMARGFEMVMHFNDFDPSQQEQYFSAMNVSRKMQAGAAIPMYITPGMDITEQVVTNLNSSFKPAAH